MTKRQVVVGGILAWVAIHGAIFGAGVLFGGGVETLTHFGHSTNSQAVHCQEDEVAIHGGLDDWYDPDLPLACVNFDEFPEIYGGSNAQVYDDGFRDGQEDDLGGRVYDFAYQNGYDDGAGFDWEQFRAETYRDGFMEGYNEGLSDAANTKIGEAWNETPTPVSTPTPAPPTPEPEVMQVALTFYTCPPFCPGDPMANGQPLEAGAVACGYALGTGQRFVFNGAEYTCEDRGGGPYYWVDFWMPDHATGQAWQASVGQVGEIVLVQ